MFNNAFISDFIESIVPITRFNKGEANRIFDEVKASGFKIVMKNNNPACVLVSPEKYAEMEEQLENYALYMEAERRVKESSENDIVSQEDIMKKFNITKEDLDNCEVQID